MYRVIEGIYRKGKIIVSNFPVIEDKTKVIITFLEHPSYAEGGVCRTRRNTFRFTNEPGGYRRYYQHGREI